MNQNTFLRRSVQQGKNIKLKTEPHNQYCVLFICADCLDNLPLTVSQGTDEQTFLKVMEMSENVHSEGKQFGAIADDGYRRYMEGTVAYNLLLA